MARAKLPGVALPVEPVVHATRLARADHDVDRVQAFDGLPMLLAEVAEIAGLEAALALAQARGGNRVYIPAKTGDDHWLVKTVGRSAADAICRHFATPSGIELDLPRGPSGLRAETWRRLYRMIDEGWSSTEITRALGISRDMVKYHRAKRRANQVTAQLDLFNLIENLED